MPLLVLLPPPLLSLSLFPARSLPYSLPAYLFLAELFLTALLVTDLFVSN